MSSIDPVSLQDETSPHRELIMGLLKLARFLTDHPRLEIDPTDSFELRLSAPYDGPRSDSDQIAYVRQVAAILGVEPQWNGTNTHFRAVRSFGPKVRIQGLAILRHAMEDYELLQELGAKAVAELHAQPAAEVDEEGQADEAGPVEPDRADVDGRGFAEVDCADCKGTGVDQTDVLNDGLGVVLDLEENGACPSCLGKGMVAAPSLQPAGQTASGGVAW
jgi:hypothetical protein